jgi:hypothetical protein
MTAIALFVVLVVIVAVAGLDVRGYVASWAGVQVKMLSGGVTAWWLSRYMLGLHLSEIPAEQRSIAGIAQAIIFGFGMLAAAVGA